MHPCSSLDNILRPHTYNTIMLKIHREDIKSDFGGTIIDIETIGFFNDYDDSRRYKDIVPVIFGYITRNELQIFCARNNNSVEGLKEKIMEMLETLKQPFHAFNCDFEKGVFFHSLNKRVRFERELNREKMESKARAVSDLKIPQYNDPFMDSGKMCMEAWQRGEIEKSMVHNRSCLLKERDILLKRGFRKPDVLKLVPD